jgi:hypothetical protein
LIAEGRNWSGPATTGETKMANKTREELLAEVAPLITEEGYDDLTYLSLEELENEVEAIKNFDPDPNIGM